MRLFSSRKGADYAVMLSILVLIATSYAFFIVLTAETKLQNAPVGQNAFSVVSGHSTAELTNAYVQLSAELSAKKAVSENKDLIKRINTDIYENEEAYDNPQSTIEKVKQEYKTEFEKYLNNYISLTKDYGIPVSISAKNYIHTLSISDNNAIFRSTLTSPAIVRLIKSENTKQAPSKAMSDFKFDAFLGSITVIPLLESSSKTTGWYYFRPDVKVVVGFE